VEGHVHNFVSLRIPDVSSIWIRQVNYAKLLEMNSFFTLHSLLEVGKTQGLPSKFWQTFGDACRWVVKQYIACIGQLTATGLIILINGNLINL
jgi:hypothetical protein